jgi:hypothetical protein
MAQPRSVNAPKPRFLKADRWLIPIWARQPGRVKAVAGIAVLVATTGVARAEDAFSMSVNDEMRRIRPKITACTDASEVADHIIAHVTVRPDGTVQAVTIEGSNDPKLDTCVANVVKKVKLAKTLNGGVFSHPFEIGTKVEPNGDLGYAIWSTPLLDAWPKIAACGYATKLGGVVKARITIDAKGKVSNVTAEGSEDAKLNTCFATAIKKVPFKRTPRGGSFSYAKKFVSGEQLDSDLVERGLATHKAQLLACVPKSPPTATFTISGTVYPEGQFGDVITTSRDRESTDCLYKVLKSATFEQTPHGGHFKYILDRAGPLDPAVIGDGIASVKAKVLACGNASKVGGRVKVRGNVAAAGKVTNATADGSTDAKLNTCVANAVKAATFAKTASGGVFVYPFLFVTPDDLPALQPNALVGDALDRAAIATGIAGIKASIVGCGNDSTVGGTVKVHVQVSPDGKVANASIEGKTDAKLNNCIANAMKTATFAKTKIGGSFSYPFVFLKDPPKGQVLDRGMIRVGVAKISAKIRGCNNGVNAKGTLKLKIVVAPAGNVTSVGIEQSPDDYVAKCVADVFATATFGKTEQGATFTHPIVF